MIAVETPVDTRGDAPASDGIDAVTGLPCSTFWRLVLGAESSRAVRYGRTATVVYVSLVGFERLVREWDEDIAAAVLVRISRLLRAGTRSSDYVARVGEDRFGILLTETAEIAAINMVERVRDRCERELSTLAPGARIAFGWASPSPSGTLLRAAVNAERRLRKEAAQRAAELAPA
ncbi:MAG: GGDEF domain-containing protein [Verrucomicrobiota bacterium]